MKSYLERYFPFLFGKKLGGVIAPEPEPQKVVHITKVEIKFTDLQKVPLYRVMKNHDTGAFGSRGYWLPHGYTDRQRDIVPFIGDREYRIDMMWGYKAPGKGFNDLVLLEQVEAAPRLPMLID